MNHLKWHSTIRAAESIRPNLTLTTNEPLLFFQSSWNKINAFFFQPVFVKKFPKGFAVSVFLSFVVPWPQIFDEFLPKMRPDEWHFHWVNLSLEKCLFLINKAVNTGKHSTMVSIIASGPSWPWFETRSSRNYLGRKKYWCCSRLNWLWRLIGREVWSIYRTRNTVRPCSQIQRQFNLE